MTLTKIIIIIVILWFIPKIKRVLSKIKISNLYNNTNRMEKKIYKVTDVQDGDYEDLE